VASPTIKCAAPFLQKGCKQKSVLTFAEAYDLNRNSERIPRSLLRG
jgi:hypothetical protein